MSRRNVRRLEAAEARLGEGERGVFFFRFEEGEDGEVRYVSNSSGRSYSEEEFVALAEHYPDAVLFAPLGGTPRGDLEFVDDETTLDDIRRWNAYVDRIDDLARASERPAEEVEATLTDPDLLEEKAWVDATRRRQEEREARAREASERMEAWVTEMQRRLDRLNGADRGRGGGH